MSQSPYSPFAILAALLCAPLTSATAQQPHGGRLDSLHDFTGYQADGDLPIIVPAGDINGDGHDDLLIGRSYDSSGGVDEGGSVELVSGVDYSRINIWYGTQSWAEFGASVTITADVNGDGAPEVAVGAPMEKHGMNDEAGGVYLYSGQPPYGLINSWQGTQAWGGLGQSLVDAGDLNGDGRSDLLMGAPWAYSPMNNINSAGIAYLYSGIDPQASGLIMDWQGTWHGDELGTALLVPGDMTGDGIQDIVIGVPGDESSYWYNWFEGKVIVVSGADGSTVMEFWGEEPGDDFGSSLACPGDIDQDGVLDILVGAPKADPIGGVSERGEVILFSGATGEDLISWMGEDRFDWFGFSVDVGDVTGDGVKDILIGAPLKKSNGELNRGAFYAFSGITAEKVLYQAGTQKDQVLGAFLRFVGDINNDGHGDFAAPYLDWISSVEVQGAASIYSSEIIPQMTASSNTVSNSTGGVVTFDMEFPDEAGRYYYQLLYSGSGVGPVNIAGLAVPLTYDLNLVNSYLGNYQSGFTNPTGLLNANGDATAKLSIPAGAIPPGIINSTFYFAAICKVAWGDWEFSSVALPVTFTP